MLSPGSAVQTSSSNAECYVDGLIGAGGQGEVYRATIHGSPVALKWYYPHTASPEQKDALLHLVDSGAPDSRFLWPIDLVERLDGPGFGYIMALREPRFRSISDLLIRR